VLVPAGLVPGLGLELSFVTQAATRTESHAYVYVSKDAQHPHTDSVWFTSVGQANEVPCTYYGRTESRHDTASSIMYEIAFALLPQNASS
jgi:hypothetical protein